MRPEFESVWTTIRKEGKAAKGQALLDRETGYAVFVEDYRESDKQYEIRFTHRARTMLVPREDMSRLFSGLISVESMRSIMVEWRETHGIQTKDIYTCPGHIWNRWLYVYVSGGDPKEMPSEDKSSFHRRIELSAWLWHNPTKYLKNHYRLSVPRN